MAVLATGSASEEDASRVLLARSLWLALAGHNNSILALGPCVLFVLFLGTSLPILTFEGFSLAHLAGAALLTDGSLG